MVRTAFEEPLAKLRHKVRCNIDLATYEGCSKCNVYCDNVLHDFVIDDTLK